MGQLVEYVKNDDIISNVYANTFKYNLQVSRIPYRIYEDPEYSDNLWLFVWHFDINKAIMVYDIVVN